MLVVGMVYLFKSIYIQKLTALLLSQAVAQSDEKKVSLEKYGGLISALPLLSVPS